MDKLIKKVKVLRQKYKHKEDWTLSKFLFDGEERGKGVEDEKRAVKVWGETRIPNGIYKMGLRYSPKFSKEYYRDDSGNLIRATKRKTECQKLMYHTQHEMLWVKKVPNFKFILWHWGNTDLDTNGCYIVGTTFGFFGRKWGNRWGVYQSRKKYEEIYPTLWKSVKYGNVEIEYKDE